MCPVQDVTYVSGAQPRLRRFWHLIKVPPSGASAVTNRGMDSHGHSTPGGIRSGTRAAAHMIAGP
jgi:hypothetical protein